MSSIRSQSTVTTVPGQTLNKGITWPDTEWADTEEIQAFDVDEVTPAETPPLSVVSLGQQGQVGQIRIVADPNQKLQMYVAKGTAITTAGQVLIWECEIYVE